MNSLTPRCADYSLFEPQRYENPVIIEDDLVARTYRTQTITSGKASGQLIGGNLTLISTLMGTPYLPDFSENIDS